MVAMTKACRIHCLAAVKEESKVICQICRQTKSPGAGTFGDLVRPNLADFIQKQAPGFDLHGFICFQDLDKFRKEYVKTVLEDEIGELSALDQEVVESLHRHELLSENIGSEFEKHLSFGERLSDRIADFGGSWRFIIIFGAV